MERFLKTGATIRYDFGDDENALDLKQGFLGSDSCPKIKIPDNILPVLEGLALAGFLAATSNSVATDVRNKSQHLLLQIGFPINAKQKDYKRLLLSPPWKLRPFVTMLMNDRNLLINVLTGLVEREIIPA